MATTVQNPFDTQQASATGTGIVGSAIQGGSTPPAPSSASETIAPAQNLDTINSPPKNTTTTYEPTTRDVNQQTGTVQGQVNSILATDSPLMQRARTLATQQMAGRGLVNSSMNAGAGVAAMTDKAITMGSQDANAYNQAASENMAAKNTSGQFNAGALNTAALQGGQQSFTAAQTELERQQQTAMQTSQQTFTAQQSKATQDFQSAQTALDRAQQTAMTDKSIKAQQDLQTAQQNFTSAQSALDRSQQTNLQNDQQEAQAKLQLAQNQADLDKLGVQIKANLQQVPATFASTITNSTMQGVNAILADGTMDAAAKKTAISNLTTYANAQIAWGAKFYGTTITPITTPTLA